MSFLPYSFHQQNGVSRKMLQSKMIQLRRKISYNDSQSLHIAYKILQQNYATNKNLLLILGLTVYERHFNRLITSATYTAEERSNLIEMYDEIIINLTEREQRQLGLIEALSEEAVIRSQDEIDSALLANPDFIFYCKMSQVGFVSNFVITNMKDRYVMTPGKKYIFDLQDESNFGYQFSLSEKRLQFVDVEGISFIGTPGSEGAFVVYQPPEDPDLMPSYVIHIYNKLNTTLDAFTVFGYIYSTFVVKLNYENPGDVGNFFFSVPPTIECLVDYSEIRASERNGPKFVLEGIDYVFTGNILLDRYTVNKQYGMHFGTYRIYTSDSTNPFTIINKGKENLIQIFGDEDKKSEYNVSGLDDMETYSDDSVLDGSYTFFYGDLYIDVIGDFGTCALYSHKYGYNMMEKLLIFSDTCTGNAGIRTDYDDISQGDMQCLYPQTNYDFELINDIPRMTFNGNTDDVYDSSMVYGLYNGQYIIQGIPEDHPIALINKGKEDYIEYIGTADYMKQRLGPDNEVYSFYYGSILVRVYGDFGKMTLYDYYHGYAGGFELFQYSDLCDYSGTWVSDKEEPTTPTTFQTIYYDISENFGIVDVESYLPGDGFDGIVIYTDDTDASAIYLTGEPIEEDMKYGLNVGQYVIRNVPENYAIAFLNNGLEDLFTYDGYLPYHVVATAIDGFSYRFFYGNINIRIAGDFGQISFYTLNHGFMNGRKKLVYSSSANMGFAITNNGVANEYPNLTTDITATKALDFNITVYVYIIKRGNSQPVPAYYFTGSDRNGSIDSSDPNPTLTYYLGDQIRIEFGGIYNRDSDTGDTLIHNSNNRYTMGLFIYTDLITDSQQITNNRNTSNDAILWSPVVPLYNYYYYRSSESSNIMFGTINILPNDSADLTPDISNVTPEDGSIISASISQIVIESNEIINVNTSLQYYFVNFYDSIVRTMSGSSISGSGTTLLTLNTGMDDSDRLSFDTSFSLVADSGLLTNMYGNDLNPLNIGSYRTEVMHDPLLLSISPQDSNDISINPTDPIILSFNEPVTFTENYSIQFIDTSNSIYSDYTSVESSGNDLYIYNTNMTYETFYRMAIDMNSIVDGSNILYDFTDSSLNNYYFYTAFDPRPKIVSTDPSLNQTDVSFDSTISITFNEEILLGTGYITIQDLSTNSVFDTFDVTSDTDISDHLTGMGTNTLTIHIDPDTSDDTLIYFDVGNSYSVLIDSTAIQDYSGNFFVGITDTSGYTFTVA